MMKATLIFLLLGVAAESLAQSKDSLLANERTMDRPITLHKGQIRVNAGLSVLNFSRRFDDDSKSIDLSDEEGKTVRGQGGSLSIAYGISDIIQLSVATGIKSQLDRDRDDFIIVDADATWIHYTRETTGLEDLNVSVDVRAPGLPKKYDVAITLGAYLPLEKSGNVRPTHTVELSEGTTTINYHYNERWGGGVVQGVAGLRAKYRSKNWALTASGFYRMPVGESTEKQWIHQLEGTKFMYQSIEYKIQKESEMILSGEFEYQPLPWVNTFLMGELRQWGNGWSSETGKKVASAEAYLASLYPGIEILITSRLWLRQRLQFSVAGQNRLAPFSIQTSISYNFFP
jgi:hypothetical protein